MSICPSIPAFRELTGRSNTTLMTATRYILSPPYMPHSLHLSFPTKDLSFHGPANYPRFKEVMLRTLDLRGNNIRAWAEAVASSQGQRIIALKKIFVVYVRRARPARQYMQVWNLESKVRFNDSGTVGSCA